MVDDHVDASRSISGEIFVTDPKESKRLRISNFIPERFPPYTFTWISEGLQANPQVIYDRIGFYFQSVNDVLPIASEQNIRTLFEEFYFDPYPNRLGEAIILGFAALSANYRRETTLAEWCYWHAKKALSNEPNDAQFEYLLGSTLAVRLSNPFL